jgi:hypothetical protein
MKVASDIMSVPGTLARCVVCLGKFIVDVVLIRTKARHRSHHDAMLKVDIPDAEGLENRGHGRGHQRSGDEGLLQW